MATITVIGGGLAGVEAAWAAAERGHAVRLAEMRPGSKTGAHQTGFLAELVCSNSLKSESLEDCSGLLKAEMRRLGSLVLAVAEGCRVPAGSALAVDRLRFAEGITARIAGHPRIQVVREEARAVPPDRPCILASGPLTSDALAADLQRTFTEYLSPRACARPPLRNAECGMRNVGAGPAPPAVGGDSAFRTPHSALDGARLLAFYDAISPIVAADSLDRNILFAASRYGRGGEDYLNCPLSREEYRAFHAALLAADEYPLHPFEDIAHFEGCLPIEVLARRGEDTLRFGPMRPVGLTDPRTGARPYAVVQLRRENREGTMVNIVGFQTRLRRGAQARIVRMIPGMGQAEILRYGSVHRNTFVRAPGLLEPSLQFRGDPGLFLAGQLVGVEGYLESAAAGLLAGLNAARRVEGRDPVVPPPTTALGAILRHIAGADPEHFQPMNVHWGLLPSLAVPPRDRRARNRALAERGQRDLEAWAALLGASPASGRSA
jgi:methylenetetrahydrofolate--tRNA-(uracil-5-)-methyltransferase